MRRSFERKCFFFFCFSFMYTLLHKIPTITLPPTVYIKKHWNCNILVLWNWKLSSKAGSNASYLILNVTISDIFKKFSNKNKRSNKKKRRHYVLTLSRSTATQTDLILYKKKKLSNIVASKKKILLIILVRYFQN